MQCSIIKKKRFWTKKYQLKFQKYFFKLVQVPVNLLRAGRVFVFEPPPGVKANLLATFNRVATPSRVQKAPTERARLYFLLAWFNAVVQERLRYAPLGWSKKFVIFSKYVLNHFDFYASTML